MKKFASACVIVSCLVIPAFAQVLAPDYKDQSKWTYIECDSQTTRVEGTKDLAWHQDFISPNDEDKFNELAIVTYKPVSESFLANQGEDKFKAESMKQPWFLMYFTKASSDIQLFEFDSNTSSWKHSKTLGSLAELSSHLKKTYKLRMD